MRTHATRRSRRTHTRSKAKHRKQSKLKRSKSSKLKRSQPRRQRAPRVRRAGPRPRQQILPVSQKIVVRFRDHVSLDYDDCIETHSDFCKVGDWDRLKKLTAGCTTKCTLNRLFPSLEPSQLQQWEEAATKLNPDYKPARFLSYFMLDCPAGAPVDDMLKEIRSWSGVERAYARSSEVIDPRDRAGAFRNPLLQNQSYLLPGPAGVDALHAWTRPGGNGGGQAFIDLEGGWTLDHLDLLAHNIQPLDATNYDRSRPHGTAVLGIICASGGPSGFLGLAPGVQTARVVSHGANSHNIAQCITRAALQLSPGDILVLEATVTGALPCEMYDDIFQAIQTCVANGIVVIEAAGNGGAFLDNQLADDGSAVFDRNFRDSGAILVGAGTAATPHARTQSSNFGTRIDCYAWGDNVFTTTSSVPPPRAATDLYDDNFPGTSAATAIIAGVALSVQGMVEASLGRRLNPLQLRQLLSDPQFGTPSQSLNDQIGVMPDLKLISGNLANLVA